MEISTAIMQHILRMSESYADVLTELRQVKKELAELKGERNDKQPHILKTKYPNMGVIIRK